MTENRKHGWAFWMYSTLLFVVIGYPLSIGPLNWIVRKLAPISKTFDRMLEAFYRPYAWLAENSPLFDKWMEWYLDFW